MSEYSQRTCNAKYDGYKRYTGISMDDAQSIAATYPFLFPPSLSRLILSRVLPKKQISFPETPIPAENIDQQSPKTKFAYGMQKLNGIFTLNLLKKSEISFCAF